jgi:hypothetical protein
MARNHFKIDRGITLTPQASAPSDPTNGDIYYNSTLGKFKKYENGTWTDIGSGAGGGGGVNFVGLSTAWATETTDDRDAETTVGNWAAYADAAGTQPVDMTGGVPNVTITRTTTAGEILNGAASFEFVKDAANRQGQGVSVVFNVPPAYQGKAATIRIPYKIVSGTVVSGDLKWFVYDVTNSALITPFNNDLIGASGTILATFMVPASATTPANIQMRLGLHVASTSTSAMDIVFDDVTVEPGLPTYGAALTDWQTYSLTIGATTTAPTKGSVIRDTARWRRVGDSVEIRYDYEQNGAGSSGSGDYLFPLPNGLQIDTSKISTNTNNEIIVGHLMVSNSTTGLANASRHGFVQVYNSTNLGLVGSDTHTGTATQQLVSSGYLGLNNTNLIYSFYALVPVLGWTSNITSGNSSTFFLSSIVANGTRVTAAPAQLGEYRTLIKGAGARTSSDNAPSQTASSIAANGMLIYSVPMGSAGTGGQPNKWEIFVGKNKNVSTEWYTSSGRTGNLSVDQHMDNTDANWYGTNVAYDPTTGIMIINAIPNHTTTNAAVGIGITEGTGDITGPSSAYFDIKVSENALGVGIESPRSEIWLYGGSGFGSTNTRVRRYTTVGKNVGRAMTLSQSATNGDSITINEDGVYTILAVDTRVGGGSTQFGISKNSTQLTTGIASITITDVLAINQCNSGDRSKNATVTTILSRGDVIRGHGDASADATANVEVMFRITKVSN